MSAEPLLALSFPPTLLPAPSVTAYAEPIDLTVESQRLLTLVKKSFAFVRDISKRTHQLTRTRELCDAILEKTSLEEVNSFFKHRRHGFFKRYFKDMIFSQYTKLKIEEMDSLESIQKIAQEIISDLRSISIPPTTKTSNGLNGPTILTSYPITTLSLEESQTRSVYVIKWVKKSEIAGNHIYETLSNAKFFYGFLSPKAIYLRAEENIFDTLDPTKANQRQLREALNLSELETTFCEVAKKTHTAIHTDQLQKTRQIMIADMIQGENLFDFIRTKYIHLNEDQKDKFFQRLGKLATLDLFTGNRDRFLKFEKYDDYSAARPLSANLGNAMIQWSIEDKKEFPNLFAIDNEIDAELSQNTIENQEYLTFLREIISQKDFHISLANHMIQSLNDGTTTFQEESVGDKKKTEEEIESDIKALTVFLDDLKKADTHTSLEIGLVKMTNHLKSFNSDNLDREYLNTLCPNLFELINKRLNILKMR